MDDVILRVDLVSKIYTMGEVKVEALKHVSVDFCEGELVVLLGTSGSGKSTLLNMIAGLDRPTSGSVVVVGQQLDRASESELARWRSRHIGFIFQLYNLIPVLTAYVNV